ncbi:MAG: hypothetical protein ABIP64_00465 [Burkholderiales bacterium]
MDQIVAYVKDPAWWFSTFVIAIIASVIAGFAKDRIGRWLGHLSIRNRERQQRKSEERKKVIQALADNEAYLLITVVRSTELTVVTLAVVMFFLLSPTWSNLAQLWCSAVLEQASCGLQSKSVSVLASMLFGLLGVVLGYISSSFNRTTMLGYEAYRKKHELPEVR